MTPSDPIIEVLPTQSDLIDRAFSLIVEKISAALAERERCTIVLSGGSTPRPIYERLAREDLSWSQIHLFWGDERYVPPDSPDSNQRMAREAWIDRVPIPDGNVHAMPTQAGDPALDAAAYESELRQFFCIEGALAFPSFDIVLLGMGDDGHTASLFPHTDALQVCDRLVTVGNKDGQPRITLTVPTLDAARCVLFVVAGENKRPALAQIFAPEADTNAYPARLIRPQGELWWLLDRAAGEAIAV